MDGWMEVKAVLRIADSNQKGEILNDILGLTLNQKVSRFKGQLVLSCINVFHIAYKLQELFILNLKCFTLMVQ